MIVFVDANFELATFLLVIAMFIIHEPVRTSALICVFRSSHKANNGPLSSELHSRGASWSLARMIKRMITSPTSRDSDKISKNS
jgi:hypothetical protein